MLVPVGRRLALVYESIVIGFAYQQVKRTEPWRSSTESERDFKTPIQDYIFLIYLASRRCTYRGEEVWCHDQDLCIRRGAR